MSEPMPQPQSYEVAYDAVRHAGERTERAHGVTRLTADSPEAARRAMDARLADLQFDKWTTHVMPRAD